MRTSHAWMHALEVEKNGDLRFEGALAKLERLSTEMRVSEDAQELLAPAYEAAYKQAIDLIEEIYSSADWLPLWERYTRES